MAKDTKSPIVDLGPLRALREEDPPTLMAQVRRAWPDIEAALEKGHSLKTIQQRLEQGGLRIRYRTLVGYVNRIREDLRDQASGK